MASKAIRSGAGGVAAPGDETGSGTAATHWLLVVRL